MKSIFLKELSNANNIHCGFRKNIEIEQVEETVIHIGGRSFYRLFINGTFVSHGGARTGIGHLRIDEIDITPYLMEGLNAIAVEVSSYGNCYQYSNNITCEYGLLTVEISTKQNTLCETDTTWQGIILPQRKTAVDRYSHCREITELYWLDKAFYEWRTEEIKGEVELVETPVLLERGMALPEYKTYGGFRLVEYGDVVKTNQEADNLFFEKEIDFPERPSSEGLCEKQTSFTGEISKKGDAITVSGGEHYLLYDTEKLLVGFKEIQVTCQCDTIIDLSHADRAEVDGVFSSRPGFNTTLRLHVKAGTWKFTAFEPCAIRYCKIVIRSKMSTILQNVNVLTYTFPDNGMGSFLTSDEEVNQIFNSAKRTLQLNTLDIFMDCPDRERGGWLCDSYWSARAQKLLFGDLTVEKAMLENYLCVPVEDDYKGIVHASYPAFFPEQKEKGSINTWTIWLFLELFDYYNRSGDIQMVMNFKKKVEVFVDSFLEYRNSFHLLSDLPGFTFIDWSPANNKAYNSPISVPANALFAYMLGQVATMYQRPDWKKAGEEIVEAIAKYAFSTDGVEDALEERDGKIVGKEFYSEAGQYTTFWTELFQNETLMEKTINGQFKGTQVAPTNMFIGYCIRQDLLAKKGEFSKLLEESKQIYGDMLKEGPGTLWESFDGKSSRCHGFASYIGYLYMANILGIQSIDEVNKIITIAPNSLGLRWAKGTTQTLGGMLMVHWENRKNQFTIHISAPKGYEVKFEQKGVYNGHNEVIVLK